MFCLYFTTTNNTSKCQYVKDSQKAFSIYFHVGLSAAQWPSLWSWAGAPVATVLVLRTATVCRGGCPAEVGVVILVAVPPLHAAPLLQASSCAETGEH